MDKIKWRGSYTVEATFVMTISIFVILCICYMAMYTHDKAILQSYVHYQMEYFPQNEKLVNTKIKASLKGTLFLVRIQQVDVNTQFLQSKAKIKYTLSLSIPFLKRILLNGNTTTELIIYHNNFKPSNLLWDAYVLKGENE